MRETGPLGEARQVPPRRLREQLHGDEVATIDYWWVHLPQQGMMVGHLDPEQPNVVDHLQVLPFGPNPAERMDRFALGLITLADLPGVPPANKRFPWYTHELSVATLDPSGPLQFGAPLPWPMVHPVNVTCQFQVADDDQAREVCRGAARALVNGLLAAEVQAYVPELGKMMTVSVLWEAWQDAIAETAEHMRTGGTHQEEHP